MAWCLEGATFRHFRWVRNPPETLFRYFVPCLGLLSSIKGRLGFGRDEIKKFYGFMGSTQGFSYSLKRGLKFLVLG